MISTVFVTHPEQLFKLAFTLDVSTVQPVCELERQFL